ncbi:transposase [Mesorhizobium sp. M0715]|uniref:transposase n=1 Tax=Mesorhizobium sp. M0715 TaxID=2956990 RepID=UPI0033352FB9
MRDAFKAIPVKTDHKDARGIAQLMRLWLGPPRALQVTAGTGGPRPADHAQAPAVEEAQCRDEHPRVLRGFGLKVGPTTPKTFERRVRELVAHHDASRLPRLFSRPERCLLCEFKTIEKRLVGLARRDAQVRNLMSAPGVGALVALTFSAAIDDPSRFRSSRMVGAHFVTPRKYQSGDTDVGGISKVGGHGVRVALYEAANAMLTRPVKGSALKSWALAVAKRAGMRKAKVALARKLAVVLHQIMRSLSAFCRQAVLRQSFR